MIRILRSLIIFFGTLLFIFFSQIIVVYLFPYPFNQINVTLISVLWLAIYRNNLNAIWIALIISLTTNLFSSLPFGVIAIAMIIAIVAARRVFEIFSNFSWYSVFFIALFGVFFYKIITYGILFVINLSFKKVDLIQSPELIATTVELAVNSVAFLSIYALSLLIVKRKRVYYSIQ